MITKTLWKPDTCNCEIEYSWDTDVPQEQRVHTVSKIIKKCAAHASTVATPIHFDIVLEENTRKNKHLVELAKAFPVLARIDGEGNSVLKEGLVNWSFDKNRKLVVAIPSLNANQKSEAQSLANLHLGNGKVVVK